MADGDDSYVPLVTLTEEVAVVTGEQDEDVLYKERAKLYRFSKELNQWNERGTGDARLLKGRKPEGGNTVRFVLRQEKTGKVVANHVVPTDGELKRNMGSDRSWVWVAQDYSDLEDVDIFTFAIRFRTPEAADDFFQQWEKARVNNDAVLKGEEPPAEVAAPAKPKPSDEAEREPKPEKENEEATQSTSVEEQPAASEDGE